MAGTIGAIIGVSNAGSDVDVIGLLQGKNGLNITQASISSIAYTVTRFEADGSLTVTGTGNFDPTQTIYDAAVINDPKFPKIGGYNFDATIPASCFIAAGFLHVMRVYFYPLSGGVFSQVWKTTPD